MQELTLYMSPGCPFCRKVITYLEQNNISVPLKNIYESSDVRSQLIEIGGRGQVPCLVVDGKAIYESDDIILWFQKNWKA